MSLVIQYPDLTEITAIYSPTHSPKGFRENKEALATTTTEFLFYLGSPSHYPESPKALGLKPVAAMNNWWPSHHDGARKLVLYWAKNPNFKPKVQVLSARNNWCGYPHMAASGCGLKIGEPPMRARLFNRYFTLMRMPVQVNRIQEKWLSLHNYKHLDTGQQATYYINGWDPATYSKDVEFKHFKLDEGHYILHGDKSGNRL